MAFESLTRIMPGTAKVFEDGRGYRFRVQGDGEFEPQVRDTFASQPEAVGGIDDPRLAMFLKKEVQFYRETDKDRSPTLLNAIEARQREWALKQELGNTLKETLGEQWRVDRLYVSPYGSLSQLEVSMQPAAGTAQRINIEHRGPSPYLMMRATIPAQDKDSWAVEQIIETDLYGEGFIARDNIIESANFSR